MVEWLKAPASKAGERDERSVSSNLTLSAMMIAALAPVAARADVDARALYRSALSHMSALQGPPFLTYRTTVPAGDGAIVVSRGDNGSAELAVVAGISQEESWNVSYRDADGVASIEQRGGSHLISSLAMFDPTWRGAFAWLRHGLGAAIVATPAPQTPEPQPATSATPPPVLAIVTAINEQAYDVSDGGAATCSDGRPGQRLWTRAKLDPLTHPMTQTIVAAESERFCTMLFHEHLVSPTVTFDLDIELHFGSVGAYYLITDGVVNGAVRPYRRPGWFQMNTSFRYDEFAFPATLPDALFVPTE